MTRGGLTEPRARLAQALPPGDYEWSVSYTAASGAVQTSQWRSFSVGAADGQVRAQDLVDGTQLAAQVVARARPRMLASGSSFDSLRSLAQQPEHLPALTLLRKRAEAAAATSVPAAPAAIGPVTTLAQAQTQANTLLSVRNERQHIENLGVIGRLDGNASFIAAAKRRVLSLADWSPTGAAAAGDANSELALALAQGLDLLWNDLSSAERTVVTGALRERLVQGSAALTMLDREPYTVASLLRLRQITQALLLSAGLPGFPEAQPLLSKVWELNRHSFHTWGQDGNQGPAIAQAWAYFAANTGMAAAVRTVSGVNLYDLAVLRRSAEQLIAFTPAGQSSLPAAFGDDAEARNLYDNHAAALRLHAQQSRDIAAIWYWQAKGDNVSNPADASVWQLLLLGVDRSAMPVGSASLANDWFSGQAGLAAMHSDIRRADRSSVYFRSSRFGAHGAAQAEQNALVYVSRGLPLLVNAGYTPFPGSPHHRNTRATRFKNALSFDGGFGQAESATGAARPTDPLSNMDAGGSLIRAQSVGNYAAVTGDATLAYRAVDATRNAWVPQLSNAIRSVVMDKANGLTFVYDWATSAMPRQWELNYHAPNAFVADAATVRSSHGGASVCLDRHGPATQFTQTSTWEVPPEVTQPAPSRGRFTTLLRSAEFAHLTVLREDCRTVPLQVTQNGAKISVLVNGRDALQFDRSGISLPAAGGAAPSVAVTATSGPPTAAKADAGSGTDKASTAAGTPDLAPVGGTNLDAAAVSAADRLAATVPPTSILKTALTASVDSSKSFASYKWLWSLECAGKVMGAINVADSGLFGASYGSSQQTLRFGKVPDPLEPARQVLMFKANRDDPLIAGAPRCELTFSPTQSGRLPVGRDFWFGFGVHLPSWVNTVDEQIIAQWHQADAATPLNPFFAISVLGDTLRIVARQNGGTVVSKATTTTPVDYRIKSLPKDSWHYFVVKARISHNPAVKPFLQVWRNGTRAINYAGPFGYNLSTSPPFAKIGHYHWVDKSNPWPVEAPTRSVLFRSPMLTIDESGLYSAEDMRGYVMRN